MSFVRSTSTTAAAVLNASRTASLRSSGSSLVRLLTRVAAPSALRVRLLRARETLRVTGAIVCGRLVSLASILIYSFCIFNVGGEYILIANHAGPNILFDIISKIR